MGESRLEIEETAAAWILKRGETGWTREDDAKLSDWLASSTAHRVAFARLDAVWRETARLKALSAGMPEDTVPTPERLIPVAARAESVDSINPPTDRSEQAFVWATLSPRRKRYQWALAASILLTAVGSATWLLLPRGSAYQTEVGGLEAVPIGDGSAVTLNTDSRIRVSLTETERLVQLERGEAFFDVAPDPARPFVVAAGSERLVALGTQFSVRLSEHGLQVVVVEGRVRLESGAGSGPSTPSAELGAGATAHSGTAGVLVQQKSVAELNAALSWREGYLVFHETSLADAVSEFNRYNQQRVVIEDEALGSLLIDGNFRATNVQAFVRLLEQGFPIAIEQSGSQLVLRAKKPLKEPSGGS